MLAQAAAGPHIRASRGSSSSGLSSAVQLNNLRVAVNRNKEASLARRMMAELVTGLPIGRVVITQSIVSDDVAISMAQWIHNRFPKLPIQLPSRTLEFGNKAEASIYKKSDSSLMFVPRRKPSSKGERQKCWGVSLIPPKGGSCGGAYSLDGSRAWMDLVLADARAVCGP